MNLVSFVTFLSFFLYVLLGIHGFKTNPRARLNRFFLMLCIACAWWAFCIAMMFIAPDHGSAWFWFRLSSPGWAIGPAIILHFSMALTDQEKLLGRWTSALLVYTPGAVITFRGITVGVTASDVVLRGFGWSPVNEGGSIWYWVYTLYYLLCLGSCLYLLWRWGKTTSLVRQKKQSRILLVCTFMGTFLAFINESLLPALGYDTVPKLPVVLFLFWALGMWYTIDKYRLMVLSPDIAIDAILAGINDLFLMLDPRERIIKVNRPVRIILGYLENELFNQPLARIMNDNLWVRDVLNHIDQQNGSIECEVDFKDKNGNLIPVKINCSPLRDRFTDLVGIVIVGSDLRPTRLLEDQNAELEAMQYDLTESNNVLALKNQQLRNFLNNTGQGFLYFAQDLLICEDYSLECVKILGCDPEGQTLASLVYKDQGDDQEIMNQVFRLALDEQNQDRVEVYLSLLPEEFIINDRCISAVYKVVNRVQEERCVLAILTDISEKRLLEQQMQEEKNIQNMLVRSIINYEEFMDCVLDYQNYCLYGINYLTGGDDEVDTLIVDTMRTIHTYKGIFSQFGTIHVVQQLHELEMTLSEKRADNGLTGDDFIEYMRQLHMEQWLEETS
jgi:PAS domain S-box-containing protein